ncbi:hypothetical protein quinque_010925 [Culex quinquefasciatus]
MLKYLTHKLRTQSINDEHPVNNEKIDGHDSGTESDGDLDQEDDLIQEHDMELSLSSRQDTASPTDTACSSESPAFLGPVSHLLAYDQNSSEEELEVINGGAASVVDSETDGDRGGGGGGGGGGSGGGSVIGLDCAGGVSVTGSSESVHRAGGLLMSLADVGGFQNVCDDELDDCAEELCLATSSAASAAGRLRPLTVTPTQLAAAGAAPKRCSSNNLLEKRKRSLAHSSDDEVRHLLENQHQQHYHQPHHHQHHHPHQPPQLMSAPVNFRTSPPLEALKPHRGHIIQRSTTPLILTDSGRGLEHIRISSSSSISSTTSSLSSLGGGGGGGGALYGVLGGGLPTCDSPATVNSSHHHQQHHQQHHQTSNNLALLSTTSGMGQDMAVATNSAMEISRSVSPPAKVFHCAVSPRRRQPSRQQRLQRPHRPCLDFDKMQQVSIYRFDAIPNSRLRKCVAI